MERENDGRAFLRQLETMLEDLSRLPASPPQSPDELLSLFEISLRTQHHSPPLVANLKQLTWEFATWFWGSRIFRKIKLIRELGNTCGWNSPCVLDAIGDLDDLVFALTYGRREPPMVKKIIRKIARQNLMATYQLRNLLQNDRIILDQKNRVIAKDSKWLVPIAIVSFIVATVAVTPFAALVLFAPIPIAAKIIGLSVYSGIYLSYCSLIKSFLVTPHKLTPQIQALLPKITIVS